MRTYRYPANKRVAEETAGLSRNRAILCQIDKAIGELCEAKAAVLEHEGDQRILEELADSEHAIEGVQRMFDEMRVVKSRAIVALKCAARGNYI